MKSQLTIFLLLLNFVCNNLFAQDGDWTDGNNKDWTLEEEKTSLFFGGINVGVLFANNNTAEIYTGKANITTYGIDYILNVPNYKTIFDTYFQYPYQVSEYPLAPSYKTALDIGLHAGMYIGKASTIYIDINASTLKSEQGLTLKI